MQTKLSQRSKCRSIKKKQWYQLLSKNKELQNSENTRKHLLSKLSPKYLGLKPVLITKYGEQGIQITTNKIDASKVDKYALNRTGLQITTQE